MSGVLPASGANHGTNAERDDDQGGARKDGHCFRPHDRTAPFEACQLMAAAFGLAVGHGNKLSSVAVHEPYEIPSHSANN
jgi:hypothetical protein